MVQRFKAPQPLERVKTGDKLSARAWNSIVDNLETLNAAKQLDEPTGIRAEDPPITEEEAEESEPAATTATTWTEQSRVTSTIDVDGVEIDRIDQMTMRDSQGNTMTWIFNNPPA